MPSTFAALPHGPFDVIVADPPWMYQKRPGARGAGPASHGAAELHYPTLSVEEIASLPVADVSAEKSHLFMWTTNPQMFGGRYSTLTARDVVAAWGFEYKTILTWVKTSQSGQAHRGGPGWYFRGATEHVIYATRGRASIPPHLREPNVFFAPKTKHSAKPDEFFGLVERITLGPRLELFARNERLGWTTWGNEIEKVNAK